MYVLSKLILFLYILTTCTLEDIVPKKLVVSDVADKLVNLLGGDVNSTEINRFRELRKKVESIDSYVIDKEKYAQLLTNETKDTNLNETNFFYSLLEEDYFRSFVGNEPKNIYLRLKEKMTRDDIIQLLLKHDNASSLVASARRSLNYNYGDDPEALEELIEDTVDKFIAETPNDNHKYDIRKVSSKYWDPQVELEELRDYHRHDARRIFKGERTNIRYYPFMVSLHIMQQFWCGGVLFWNDLVLTSASCLQLMHNNRFFRENPKVLEVRVGSNHSRVGGEMIAALEVFFHPAYEPRTLANNVAAVRLRRHVRLSYHRVPKVIEISHGDQGLPNTAEVLILGWGVTKTSQKMKYEPIFLQRKFLPVYPHSYCKEIYGDKFISHKMFCAGTVTTGEGACDHDAGGPAVLGGRLVGLISFGPAVCGFPDMPTVFTLVGAYADWIESVNESMPEYYRGPQRTTSSTHFPYDRYTTSPGDKKGAPSAPEKPAALRAVTVVAKRPNSTKAVAPPPSRPPPPSTSVLRLVSASAEHSDSERFTD